MKICLSSNGNSSDSIMDPRFGRAAYFAIADTETMKFEIIENSAADSGGGAGITSAQLMVDKGVKAVITGNVGPNAMNVLKTAEIDIYRGTAVSLKENLEKLNKGLLDKIDTTVPEHYGMQGGRK
ncbi:NifB/NifX family molybdenum-iron cluster-binding protein [Pseudobacteroides cellulosolvens]|uniref:Dinitrogenase iron-molybdenum cofactor biosynthesis protein n=1 Tax=Pseudobacteroides cellulosolvens ATCC 35603 = DSM 2933 TaxID=398512 RepID=A0A0L6JUT3_9FIRM|nr:NifB/NifX family molybdenum-iron cluster-binding protein [Pseudobacteroides cellulosolvens]KNY29474.1 Dinitrogenase iron-molybdenum cofactor biosynthesis protein [Pseudobacteroides cellulosolvens ATCC 35603 = DSM 2933]